MADCTSFTNSASVLPLINWVSNVAYVLLNTIAIIILRHILYLVCLGPCLGLGLFLSMLRPRSLVVVNNFHRELILRCCRVSVPPMITLPLVKVMAYIRSNVEMRLICWLDFCGQYFAELYENRSSRFGNNEQWAWTMNGNEQPWNNIYQLLKFTYLFHRF